MLLDRGHSRWALATGVLLAAALAWYAVAGGPAPSSVAGLTFGGAGLFCVLFAAFLGLRKKRPHYRLGRLATWLKGHLWLGALSFPLILLHGRFAFGGPLTQALMWIFVFVFLTGIYGLVLQQFLPRLMTTNIVHETVYEQIDHVRGLLLEEALALSEGKAKGGAVAKAKEKGAIRGRVVSSRAAVATTAERVPLSRFVERHVRPFFQRDGVRTMPDMSDERRRTALFVELRRTVDPDLHGAVDDLEMLCIQRAQLEVQRRMHHWLHGWLLVHVPLAWAMVILSLVHAVVALSY